MPPELTPKLIHIEVTTTKALLDGYKREDFLILPRLDKRSKKFWHIKMWKMAMLLSFHLNTSFAPMIAAKIIQLSAECGWCADYSAFGLYSFGHSLISITQNIEDGYFW